MFFFIYKDLFCISFLRIGRIGEGFNFKVGIDFFYGRWGLFFLFVSFFMCLFLCLDYLSNCVIIFFWFKSKKGFIVNFEVEYCVKYFNVFIDFF